MKTIVIVVAGGRVETVFAEEEVNVEIIDFDGCCDYDEQEDLGNYIDECRETMKEIIC